MGKILVVDDEEDVRILNRALLCSLGHIVDTAIDGLDALEQLAQSRYDLVVTDMNMPFMDGATLIQNMARDYPSVPVIVISGQLEDYKDRFVGNPQVKGYWRKSSGFAKFSELVGAVADCY